MATTIQHKQARVGTAGEVVPGAVFGHDGQPTAARLTTEQVWHQVAKASFAVLSQVTPAGEPRSSGVVYKTIGRRLYVAVAPDSWKARHTMTASLTDPKIGHSDHEFLGIDELGMKARIAGILNRWPAVGLAVGVVRNGSLEFFHGHGLADIASSTPHHRGQGLSDRLHQQGLHGDRGDAAVGAGACRPIPTGSRWRRAR